MKYKPYPDELTHGQAEKYVICKSFDDLAKAYKFAYICQGQVYTEVDGGRGVLYTKGVHFINHTGNYLVIRDKGQRTSGMIFYETEIGMCMQPELMIEDEFYYLRYNGKLYRATAHHNRLLKDHRSMSYVDVVVCN
jgi:hypothetical protein